MKTTTTYLNFGGFYQSIHTLFIESQIEQYEEPCETTGETTEFNSYSELTNAYSKEYVNFINELIDSNFEYDHLSSPKFYNFETDVIVINGAPSDFLKVFKYIRENDLTQQAYEKLRETTTACPGYMPFFSFSDMFKTENRDKLIQTLLQVICETSEDEFAQYYDFNSMYELVYQY